MKNIVSLLAIIGLVSSVAAQYVAGPEPQRALVVSGTAYAIPGATLTNIPAANAPVFRVGQNGVGIGVYLAGTNAATTTNATIVLEPVAFTASGAIVAVGNQTWTVSAPQNGTSGYQFFTNIVGTSPNLGNVPGVRIRSINNTNIATIFITNITAYVK
jgi:hypothetical protein